MTRFIVLILAVTPMLLLYQNFSSHDLSEKALAECQPQVDSNSGKVILECPMRTYAGSQSMSVSERQSQYQFFLPSQFDARSEKRFPLIVHIETSDFVPPMRETPTQFARHLAGLGFLVAVVRPGSMNHKWNDEVSPLSEVTSFIRLVTSPVVTSHYKIDSKKISLSGSDLGGYLALMEATRGEFRYAGVIAARPLVKLDPIFMTGSAGSSSASSDVDATQAYVGSVSQVFTNWFGPGQKPESTLSAFNPFNRLINLRAAYTGFVDFPKSDSGPTEQFSEDLKNFNAVAAVSERKLGLRKGATGDYAAQFVLWNELYQEITNLNSLHMAGR